MDMGKIALAISLIALIIGAAGLYIAYTAGVGTLTEEISDLKDAISDLSDDLDVLGAQIDTVETSIQTVADATGVPLEDPGAVEEMIAWQKLQKAAMEEGRVNLYTVGVVFTKDPYLQILAKEFPLPIDITRLSNNALFGRFVVEKEAGLNEVDVIMINYVLGEQLKEQEYIVPYAQTGLKEYQHIPEMFVDPDGFYYGVYYTPNVICYNTELVPDPSVVPTDWYGLTDPMWKGKLIMGDPMTDQTTFDWLTTLEGLMGDRWEPWMRDLAANEPLIQAESGTALIRLLAQGEGYLSLNQPKQVMRDYGPHIMDDPPVWFTATGPWVPAGCVVIAQVDNAPHPNAAKLFIEYMLSVKGQQDLTSISTDQVTRTEVLPPDPIYSELNLVKNWEPSAYLTDEERQAYFDLYEEIFY
ncbi:MAG: ABC transporter substrate-binding protein [Candidatus Hodarchaeota archaeon]